MACIINFTQPIGARFACTDGRFKEAAEFYEPLVQSKLDELLTVPAIVLANLCVCYIMTSQNDQAEALMRQVERQEQQQASAVSFGPSHSNSKMLNLHLYSCLEAD